jgi:hypothetical protein
MFNYKSDITKWACLRLNLYILFVAKMCVVIAFHDVTTHGNQIVLSFHASQNTDLMELRRCYDNASILTVQSVLSIEYVPFWRKLRSAIVLHRSL